MKTLLWKSCFQNEKSGISWFVAVLLFFMKSSEILEMLWSSVFISLSSFFNAFFTLCCSGKLEYNYIFSLSSSFCFLLILTILLFTSLMTLFHSDSINCFSFIILSICCSWASNIKRVYSKLSLNSWDSSSRNLFVFFSSLIKIPLLSI